MDSNCVMFSWKRCVPGREKISAAHFNEFLGYLTEQQQKGGIDSFEPVLLNPAGDGVNGFFLIRGSSQSLSQMTATREWKMHVMRASFHLENPCQLDGACGKSVMEQMEVWSSLIPD